MDREDPDLLSKQLVDLLKSARKSKKDTLADAAKAMHMGKSKANVHNLETGNPIPWTRLIEFADYTGTDVAAVLILQSARRALAACKGSDREKKRKRRRIYDALHRLLRLEPSSPLSDLLRPTADTPSQLMRERERLLSEPPLSFWRTLIDAAPQITPPLIPAEGEYRDLTGAALIDEAQTRVVLRGSRVCGAEFVLLKYLQHDRWQDWRPIFVDSKAAMQAMIRAFGCDAEKLDLAAYINKEVIPNVLPDERLDIRCTQTSQAPCAAVFHNLPDREPLFEHVLRNFSHSNPAIPLIVLADEHRSVPELAFDSSAKWACYDVGVLPDDVIHDVLNTSLITHLPGGQLDQFSRLKQRLYPRIRHPFWLALLCRMVQTSSRLPSAAQLMATGVQLLSTGDFDPRMKAATFCVKNGSTARARAALFEKAYYSLGLDLASGRYGISLPEDEYDSLSNGGLFLEHVSQATVRFSYPFVHVYCAMLHVLRQFLMKPTDADSVWEALSRLSADDTKRCHFLAETFCEEVLGDDFDDLSNVLQARMSEYRKRAEGRAEILREEKPLGRILARHGALVVLVENQRPGRALQELVSRGSGGCPDVEVSLTSYGVLRDRIRALQWTDAEDKLPVVDDLIVCPHYALFNALVQQDIVVPLQKDTCRMLNKSVLTLGKRIGYERETWYGVPFQYPTKVICYRRQALAGAPFPRTIADLMATLKQCKTNPDSGGLGLQGKLDHPALYYEWLAFAMTGGGGDVLWDPWLASPEVILDQAPTVEATRLFLELFDSKYSHRSSISWDWASIATSMRDDPTLAMCFPFTDTVATIIDGQEDRFGFAPWMLSTRDVARVDRYVYGYGSCPRHVFTGHVFALIARDEKMQARANHFLQWFMRADTQSDFALATCQAPPLASEFARKPPDAIRDAMEATRAAQRALQPPVPGGFTGDDNQLADYQSIVLGAVSRLLEDRNHIDIADIKDRFKTAASQISGLVTAV